MHQAPRLASNVILFLKKVGPGRRPVLEFDVIYSARRALSLGTYCSLVVSELQPCPHAVLRALSLGEQPFQLRLYCRVCPPDGQSTNDSLNTRPTQPGTGLSESLTNSEHPIIVCINMASVRAFPEGATCPAGSF